VGQVRNVCEGKNANGTNMGVCDSLHVGVCGRPPAGVLLFVGLQIAHNGSGICGEQKATLNPLRSTVFGIKSRRAAVF